jgi:pimeloyl-ACP methyl ester carboxylesterase
MLARVSPALAARLALDRFLKPSRRELDAVDAAALASARLTTLRVADVDVQVYEWGEAGAPTLLLLHGWGSHAPRFSAFIDGALARGWRALAFDAPGHGRSTGRRSSLARFRAALDAVIASYGPVRAVVAHSLGALATATRLADPAAAPALRAAALVSLPRDVSYLLETYLEILAARPAMAGRVRALFQERYGGTAAALSATALAPHITCPVLLVQDRDDDVVPVEQAEELARLLPHGALHLTQGLGHSGMLRDPATVNAVLGFLTPAMED